MLPEAADPVAAVMEAPDKVKVEDPLIPVACTGEAVPDCVMVDGTLLLAVPVTEEAAPEAATDNC